MQWAEQEKVGAARQAAGPRVRRGASAPLQLPSSPTISSGQVYLLHSVGQRGVGLVSVSGMSARPVAILNDSRLAHSPSHRATACHVFMTAH